MEESVIESAREEAKNRLQGFINKNQIGYNGYLESEMKQILNEKGIDWKPKDNGTIVDIANEIELSPKENEDGSKWHLVVYKKESLFSKIINRIKRIFGRQ